MKKIVLKIGTSTITKNTGKISYAKIEDLAKQISFLQKNYQIIIVSSGAIAAAESSDIDITKEITGKQAMSAVGQVKLINIYHEVFSSFNLKIAQCLTTSRDFEDISSRQNIFNTVEKLLNHNYIPVFNENDMVIYEEILFGDNDKLSALVATLLKVNLLVIASDIDGLYNQDPYNSEEKNLKLIKKVDNINPYLSLIKEKKSSNKLGTGSIGSKIEAANICMKNNIEMWLINGMRENFLVDAIEDKIKFTKFLKK